MKVSNNNPNASIAGLDKTNRTKDSINIGGKNQAEGGGVVNNMDKLNLSARSQEIAKAKQLATPSNDVDEAKVARLQSLIDAGKYEIDAGAIADSLLTEHGTIKE